MSITTIGNICQIGCSTLGIFNIDTHTIKCCTTAYTCGRCYTCVYECTGTCDSNLFWVFQKFYFLNIFGTWDPKLIYLACVVGSSTAKIICSGAIGRCCGSCGRARYRRYCAGRYCLFTLWYKWGYTFLHKINLFHVYIWIIVYRFLTN